MHYAATNKAEECARLLLSRGSQPNARDKFGNTPLHFAVLNKDIEMCRALEEHGSDARIKNNDGLSSIDVCYIDKDQTMINYFKSLNKYTHVFNNLYEWIDEAFVSVFMSNVAFYLFVLLFVCNNERKTM